MCILSSISRGLEFQSVNHTSMYETSKLKIFRSIKFLENYLVVDETIYYEEMYC